MKKNLGTLTVFLLFAAAGSGCPPEENASDSQPLIQPGNWAFTITWKDAGGSGVNRVIEAGVKLLPTGIGDEYYGPGSSLSVPLSWTQNGFAFYMNQSDQRIWYEARVTESNHLEGRFFHEVDQAYTGTFIADYVPD